MTQSQSMPHFKHKLGIFFLLFLSISLSACQHTQSPTAPESAKTLYESAQVNLKKGRYEQAIRDFKTLQAHYPYGEYTDQALLDLSEAYLNQGDTQSALATLKTFFELYPLHNSLDKAYYLRAKTHADNHWSLLYRYLPVDRSLRQTTHAESAIDDFQLLLKRFPNSPYAIEAREQVKRLRNQLANHELQVANYYYRKSAYLACANRLSGLVQHFQDSEAYLPGLLLLKQAYDKLGLNALSEATQIQIHQASSPSS